MAERSIAAVLKTVIQKCIGGSNPSVSARKHRGSVEARCGAFSFTVFNKICVKIIRGNCHTLEKNVIFASSIKKMFTMKLCIVNI